MAFKPVSRRSVPDEVFEQLLTGVVDGELAVGETLPAERRLAEVLGVSRPAVREALQRLAQTGLVEVRHGDATTVRDFRRHAGLDLLPRLLFRGGEVNLPLVRGILEARLIVGPTIARLAAKRIPDDLGPALLATIDELAAATDPVSQQRAALSYWEHVVDGADSIVFRLMFNNLRAAYEPAIEVLAAVMAPEVNRVKAYRALADAIVAGDGTRASQLAEDLLATSTAEFNAALDQLEQS
jgi:GntR family transcriptional repressor for pyruvate dehydrogenase complex